MTCCLGFKGRSQHEEAVENVCLGKRDVSFWDLGGVMVCTPPSRAGKPTLGWPGALTGLTRALLQAAQTPKPKERVLWALAFRQKRLFCFCYLLLTLHSFKAKAVPMNFRQAVWSGERSKCQIAWPQSPWETFRFIEAGNLEVK